jgi:hypothetical protein
VESEAFSAAGQLHDPRVTVHGACQNRTPFLAKTRKQRFVLRITAKKVQRAAAKSLLLSFGRKRPLGTDFAS